MRKLIQIVLDGPSTLGLFDDGTLWVGEPDEDKDAIPNLTWELVEFKYKKCKPPCHACGQTGAFQGSECAHCHGTGLL